MKQKITFLQVVHSWETIVDHNRLNLFITSQANLHFIHTETEAKYVTTKNEGIF
jgi:hypothetical protein